MKWARRLIARFLPEARSQHADVLDETRPSHREAIRKADRAVEQYRRLGNVLQIYIARRRG